MAEDEFCCIIYQMDFVDYFEQIKLLDGGKQNSKTIVVDNDSDERKKLSSHCKKNFGGNPTMHNAKDCMTHMVTSRKCPASDHMT
eukprot:13043978-Ditylum_brightwellii.AAC.1